MLKLIFGAALGAAAAWFLDPNDGTRRRNTTRDKALKLARKGKDQASEQATYATSTIKGKAAEASPTTSREPGTSAAGCASQVGYQKLFTSRFI